VTAEAWRGELLLPTIYWLRSFNESSRTVASYRILAGQ
jgi:hypothetical protein